MSEFECANGHYRVEDGKLFLRKGFVGHEVWVEVTHHLRISELTQVVEAAVKVGDVCPLCYRDFTGVPRYERQKHTNYCVGQGSREGYSEQGVEFFIRCGPSGGVPVEA